MESTAISQLPIAVVGGGVAGISAAFHLSQSGVSTILFERSDRLGGRISSFFDKTFGTELDLGVHIISGGYRHFLSLLRGFGTEKELHWIQPLHLPFKGIGTPTYHLRFRPWPGIWGLLPGFLSYRAVTISERMSLIRQMFRLASMRHVSAISVETWLSDIGATPKQRSRFWEPLILATLNAEPRQVGLAGLRQIIRLGLSQPKGFSLGLPLKPWQEIVGDPALNHLKRRGVEVHFRSKVTQVLVEGKQACGIIADGRRWPVSAVILSVSPWDWRHIFPREQFDFLFDAAWLTPPSSAVHSLYFPSNTRPPMTWPMFGLLGMTNHWAFVRCSPNHGSPWLISTVMSASDHLLSEPEDKILAIASGELRALWPDFALESGKARCIRLRRATCPFDVDLESRRPVQKTEVAGLFLAGDATKTGLPATLESAARAGFLAAEAFLREKRRIPLQ
ncbi:MAG: hydroxysqualene dehydroxylase HpnE [bacterium]